MTPWDARVAREGRYELLIETAFDQAEEYARAGEIERALEALSEAEDLAGGLPAAYLDRRRRWISALDPLAVVARR